MQKRMIKMITAGTLTCCLAIGFSAQAREILGLKRESKPKSGQRVADACSAPTATIDLDINNVRAQIMNGGDMWWDRGLGVARYEVPKIDPPGSKPSVSSLFASSVWIGGIDASGNLRVAAQTYRQNGNDFWSGPLDNSAAVDNSTCNAFDRFWKVNLSDIETHLNNTNRTEGNTPKSILEWPATGNEYAKGAKNADISAYLNQPLAPYRDVGGSSDYNPLDGDYPVLRTSCNKDAQPDQMIWWVYNDKGNIHTETEADPIGLQVNATAFAFVTNDEVNNMTFYRYELYNKGTYTLDTAFIAQWVDPDLGCYQDDYIGCDTTEGLGICYNADADDVPCPAGYGSQDIPIVGIDFFEGPKDASGKQLGMTGFYYYYNTTPSQQADPQNAVQFYGYMTGTWRDGTPYTVGGNGHLGTTRTHFVYPSDPPLAGATDWSMYNPVVVTPGDLRIVESSGPFQLIPGAAQVVTVGAVWIPHGDYPRPSFAPLLKADRKAQALFDNCFKLIDGPDAPDLSIKEYDKQLILTIGNTRSTSNNYRERYSEMDPTVFSAVATLPYDHQDTLTASYLFEGYQIFQLKDQSVSSTDLNDLNKARQVAQVDIKNGVTKIINYVTSDVDVNTTVAVLKVDGEDKGIKHTFSITQDAFASGNNSLVNHKNYYFMVQAYAYNGYKQGTKENPYVAGRKNVKVYSGIPHIVDPEQGGTVLHSNYGDGPRITRIEGYGNGGLFVNLSDSSINTILANNYMSALQYDTLGGPISIKVIDPKHVKPYDYTLYMYDSPLLNYPASITDCDSITRRATWKIVNNSVSPPETRYADTSIARANEQLFEDWGFSVSINQKAYACDYSPKRAAIQDDLGGFIDAKMEGPGVADAWLTGIPDGEGDNFLNWIRSGTYLSTIPNKEYSDYNWSYNSAGPSVSLNPLDPKENFEKMLGGTWAPYRFCANEIPAADAAFLAYSILPAYSSSSFNIAGVNSNNPIENYCGVDVVFTNDKSKWTKCPVVEACPDPTLVGFPTSGSGAYRLNARKHDSWDDYNSVDANGNPIYKSGDQGLSWFPGYAINVETGERLDMMFAEDSYLPGENGNDMLWNPTSNFFVREGRSTVPKMAGRHYVYVLNTRYNGGANAIANRDDLASAQSTKVAGVFKKVIWVNVPLLVAGKKMTSAKDGLIPSEVKVKIRISRPYATYDADDDGNPATSTNNEYKHYPKYAFSMKELAADTNSRSAAQNALDLINVVPNPYYGYSNYETNQLDNRIKITNLPRKCTISVFSVNGTLIRQFKRDTDSPTSQDWDLKNTKGVPVSSGLYLIHISAEGLGKNEDQAAERVIKWFGVMRPTDLNNF